MSAGVYACQIPAGSPTTATTLWHGKADRCAGCRARAQAEHDRATSQRVRDVCADYLRRTA